MVEATGAPIGEYFAALDDPRIDRSKRHKLLDIVTIAICGTICGADNWVDIELFGNCKEEWFKPELPISSCLDPSNAPSSTRAIVVSLTDAVNHPIKLTNPSLGVVS